MLVLGVIQVRMGSARLPGKALALLGSSPILEWVTERVKQSQLVERWVVATSSDQSCDSIAELCEKLNVPCHRGSENDVLSRFAECVVIYQPDYVVRVCADNPFVSGETIDSLVTQICAGDEYLANHRTHARCEIADGFGAEVIKANSLLESAKRSRDPQVREHVTLEIRNRHVDRQIQVDSRIRHSDLRFDVDTAEELARLNEFVNKSGTNFLTSPAEIVEKRLADEMQKLLEDLYPIHRSLAGEENRTTLDVIGSIIPLQRKSIRSGSEVFDWSVPPEWSISEAWISDLEGNRLVDLAENHLHVVAYSTAVDVVVTFEELKERLFTHSIPEAIPYRTAYYKRDWGFCVTQNQLMNLRSHSGPFRVFINAEFKQGQMDFADAIVHGRSSKEILISTYFCHPNLANDSLSGVVLTTFLARYLLSKTRLRYSYRFVFVPETIGALVYLHDSGSSANKIECGLQVTTVGGPGTFQVKKSWDDRHPINNLARSVMDSSGVKFEMIPFDIHGSDERQYSSPGFRINMITIAKDIYYSYREYHSSLDDLSFVTGQQILQSFELYVSLINAMESRRIFERVNPFGEPMLSKHDLYSHIGGALVPGSNLGSMDLTLWVLFLSDGHLSTSDIAERMKVDESAVIKISELLVQLEMLREV